MLLQRRQGITCSSKTFLIAWTHNPYDLLRGNFPLISDHVFIKIKKTPEYCEAGATSQAPALQLATGYQLHIATWFQWCFAQWEQKTHRNLEVWHLSVWTSFTKMDLPNSSSSAVITFHHFNCLYQALWSVMNFWQTTINSSKFERVKYTMIRM